MLNDHSRNYVIGRKIAQSLCSNCNWLNRISSSLVLINLRTLSTFNPLESLSALLVYTANEEKEQMKEMPKWIQLNPRLIILIV